MTYAYMKKYSPGTDKRGFYIDGPNWTLQTSTKADRLLRQGTRYHDDTELPLTVVKALVHLGEAETEGRESKEKILDWFPNLNPEYCDMTQKQLNNLREFIEKSLKAGGLPKHEFWDFNDFLQYETPIDPLQWDDSYSEDSFEF